MMAGVDGDGNLARLEPECAPRSFWPRPRIRRPLDVALLLLSGAALAVLVLLAVLDPGPLRATARLVPPAPTS